MGCACGEVWRVETCNLSSGIVRNVLHPLSFEFQTFLNGVGQGSMTLATKETLVRDIWPHLTVFYFSRIAGPDGASQESPVAEFAALAEQFRASDDGTTVVGFRSLEQYLYHRNIRAKREYTQIPQTSLGQSLVNEALPFGVQLIGQAASSAVLRDRTYESWDRKNIGEAVEELTNVLDGPDWETTHVRTPGVGKWQTFMTFRDYVGEDRGISVRSDREGAGYSLEVDASDHANMVDGIGAGEEEDMLIATATDDIGIPYPQFDAAPAWKDVTVFGTLQEHADGYLEDFKEPIAVPSMVVKGLDPNPAELRLGDTVQVDNDFGAVTYHGKARLTSISWGVSSDEAITRTLEFLPLEPASQSVLNQESTEECKDC